MMNYKQLHISKLLLIYVSIVLSPMAHAIDKTKILKIIKAAKQHKSVQVTSSNNSTPIVIYKKSSIQKQKEQKKIYGTLLSIPPTSVTLKNHFLSNVSSKRKNDISLFKTPIQKKEKGINTTATRIKYY